MLPSDCLEIRAIKKHGRLPSHTFRPVPCSRDSLFLAANPPPGGIRLRIHLGLQFRSIKWQTPQPIRLHFVSLHQHPTRHRPPDQLVLPTIEIAFEFAPMAKVLLLRSSEGKVLVAPTWDKRPTAQALPLETGVPSRPLERVVQFWVKHALTATSSQTAEALAAWDADFLRRLDHDGLKMEVAAAARQLRLNDDLSELLSDFAWVGRPAVSCASHARAAARADLAVARADLAAAVRADARSDHGAATRRRGFKRAACRGKKPMAKSRPAATDGRSSRVVTAPAKLYPSSCPLRARRGLPELTCKCPKQTPTPA